MIKEAILDNIKKYNQEHILKGYDTLSDEIRKDYDRQINNLDFKLLDVLKAYVDDKKIEKGLITPLEALQIKDIEPAKEKYREIGITAIKDCKVGAVLLAGGQGTRLGFEKPKGMFNIGVDKEVFIFQRLVENIMDVVNESGAYVPLMIMTSEKNHEDTVDFFEEHNYFGYDKDYVMFFKQNMAPSVDFEGKLLMEDKGRLSLSPNGNGGWFSSIVSNGLLEKVKDMGVEWLNVFSVDNVLQRIADPGFVGAVIESGVVSGAKVVRKVHPDEKVGVMCNEDGRPSIIEYYELTDAMRDAKDADGEPAYNYGTILNYLFKISELEKILDERLPIHIVEKKISYMNMEGEYILPETPNGYKFEELILDMVHMLDSCLPYEVEREKEFAPVKNKEGVDSIDTARELLVKNGIEI